jgi:beta-glucosidase
MIRKPAMTLTLLKTVSLPLSLAALLAPLAGFGEGAPAAQTAALLRKPATLEQAESQARELMERMTPAERFDFVCGHAFGIRGVPRLGIPQMKFGDASCGLRMDGDVTKNRSTAFPCTLLLAATWDAELAQKYAEAVAEEFRADGRHFILGPGMNLYRTSKDGRNFEFLGEDPFLAGQIVAAYVRGAQSLNVATTLKHFVANDTELHRRAANSIVDERTLREIYLAPFVSGVDAGSWAVMTSYNPVNGEWAAQNRHVVTDLLRGEIGFKYLVMTDWSSAWYGDKLARSGVDLEEPDGFSLKLDRDKVFGGPDIDRMVVSILKTCIASGLYELESTGQYRKPEWRDRYPAHEQLARKVNEQGIVLLANRGLLPVETAPKGKILVAGNAARQRELAGGGSGHVVGYNLSTCLEAVQQAFGAENVLYSETPADDEIRSAGLVLLFAGRPFDAKNGHEGEASNHPFGLPDDALIARCVKFNARTVVNLVCGGGAQMDWADSAGAIVQAFYGGQTGPEALLDVLTGKVNPSGKLPFTIEKRFEDSCAAGDDQLAKRGKTLADPKDMGRRLHGEHRWDFLTNAACDEYYTYDLEYKEGVFVGYRWYDQHKIKPRFPFGFGLSYTKFSYSDLEVSVEQTAPAPSVTVRFRVTNTGKRAGGEIAQLYVEDPGASAPRPVRELKGFSRVSLAPGENAEVTIKLGPEAFRFWHPVKNTWVVEPGAFKIGVGASSRDVKLSKSVKL